jgi:hypothetical protein
MNKQDIVTLALKSVMYVTKSHLGGAIPQPKFPAVPWYWTKVP